MKPNDLKKFRKKLLTWYHHHQRRLPWRETIDPYHIWVSEVMLQQTQIKTVLPYYRNFLLQFPDVQHLAASKLQDVLKAWEGMGYYARARNLHRAAKVITTQHHGKVPEDPTEIRKLPGVGDYIAAAVLSIAYNRPHAVVDGNVKRVLARLYKIDAPINTSSSFKTFKTISKGLIDLRHPGLFNQAMMDLGSMLCKPKNPLCHDCPLPSFCHARQEGVVSEYPKRIQKPAVPLNHIVAGVIYKDNHMLITRRKSEGLLGGLWEFPGGKVRENESPESACSREIKEEVNLEVRIHKHITRVKHAYTHFKIIMDVFVCEYVSGEVQLNGPADYHWIALHEIDQYPFPKANRKFIPLLDKNPFLVH
jgi:A/G-specific adenine glycosylase